MQNSAEVLARRPRTIGALLLLVIAVMLWFVTPETARSNSLSFSWNSSVDFDIGQTTGANISGNLISAQSDYDGIGLPWNYSYCSGCSNVDVEYGNLGMAFPAGRSTPVNGNGEECFAFLTGADTGLCGFSGSTRAQEGLIRINSNAMWSSIPLAFIARHEMGHFLGHNHVTTCSSTDTIMFVYPKPATCTYYTTLPSYDVNDLLLHY